MVSEGRIPEIFLYSTLKEEMKKFEGKDDKYFNFLKESEENILNEAISVGGFISFIKRWFTGKDDDIEDQVMAQMKKVKTESDRDTLIDEIDEVLSNTKNMNNKPTIVARILGLDLIGGIWTAINRGNGSVRDFHAVLRKLKKEVEKMPLNKN